MCCLGTSRMRVLLAFLACCLPSTGGNTAHGPASAIEKGSPSPLSPWEAGALRPSRKRRLGAQLSLLENTAVAQHKSAIPVPDNLPYVIHQKNAGESYAPGSDLYRKQEHLKKKRLDAENIPLSTTMNCVIALICVFIALGAILKTLQMLNYARWIDRRREEKSWGNVEANVVFIPMLCVLFLAARLQAMHYTRGDPELFGLPQWWVKDCMASCTGAVFMAIIYHLLVEACTSDDRSQQRSCSRICGMVLRTLLWLSMCVVYLCITVVCVGVVTMQPPGQFELAKEHSHINPAIICIVFLSVVYFLVYLGLVIVKTANEVGLLGQRKRFNEGQEYLVSINSTVDAFAPMLCVCFLGTRIRAMQLDPLHGSLEPWVQSLYYCCSLCFVLHTLFQVISTCLDLRQQGDSTGQYSVGARGPAAIILEVSKLLLVGLITAGVFAVSVRFFTANTETNVASRPLALTLQCTVLLTVVYFAIYFLHSSVVTVQRASNWSHSFSNVEVYLRQARDSLDFCPKFSILFLGTFMRALYLTDGDGAPQAWCQISQCIATATIVALALVRGISLAMNKQWGAGQCLVYILSCVAYVCAVENVVAIYMMTPENANGPGSTVDPGPDGALALLMMAARRESMAALL